MWVDIKGYEGIYKISDNAEVMNIKTGLIKRPWVNNKGYLCIDLSKNGITNHYLLHRLYAEAFIPNPNNCPIILHLDNNKQNISMTNLAWDTYSENNAQAIADGLNKIPRPDNRKYFAIFDGEKFLDFFYGQEDVLKALGYGSISVVQNLLHRKDKIKEGPYKGCYLERVYL